VGDENRGGTLKASARRGKKRITGFPAGGRKGGGGHRDTHFQKGAKRVELELTTERLNLQKKKARNSNIEMGKIRKSRGRTV